MTAPPPARCICPTCVARSLNRAAMHLRKGRPDFAEKIIQTLLRDLPPSTGACMVEAGTDPYIQLAELDRQLIEYKGWAHAYQVQERARLPLGDACPCLSGARR
jgi:hypothetical protein